MTIHTLEKEKHNNFLAQNRIDPITGDLLQENDRIVICSACKSAFLVDSWKYMNRKHCEQRLTLKEIPINEIVKIERFNLIDFEGKTIPNSTQEVAKTMMPYFVLGYLIYYLLDYFSPWSSSFIAMLFTCSCFYCIYIHPKKSTYKNILVIRNNILFFDKKKSQNGTLELEEIEDVKLYKSKRHSFRNIMRYFSSTKNSLYTIKITAKDKSVYKILLEKKELERIKTKTNLLQKFNKNSLPFLSVNSKVKEITK